MSSPEQLGTITSGLGILSEIGGTALASSAYKSAGDAALSAAQYNSQLIDLNLNRQLDSLAGELRTFTSSQRAQIAKSGVSLTSKSALIVQSEAISNFAKEAVLAKENAKFGKDQQMFAAQQQRSALRTQSFANLLGGLSSAAFSSASLFADLNESNIASNVANDPSLFDSLGGING